MDLINNQTGQLGEGEVIHIKSPVSVNGAIKTKDCFSEIVTEVISLLGSKGLTFETAMFILDKSKEALPKCTLLQQEYTP
ncbi:hypothetical protein [Paenibacillus sp. BAC0078]